MASDLDVFELTKLLYSRLPHGDDLRLLEMVTTTIQAFATNSNSFLQNIKTTRMGVSFKWQDDDQPTIMQVIKMRRSAPGSKTKRICNEELRFLERIGQAVLSSDMFRCFVCAHSCL